MYKKAVMTPASHEEVAGDFPERPGYSVVWNVGRTGFTFRMVGAHIDPDNVAHELHQLGLAAAAYANAGGGGTSPVLTLGDFNADCSYLGVTAWKCIRDPECTDVEMALWDGATFAADNWLLDDDADTTVAASSCAYDRIVASAGLLPRVVAGSVQVHNFGALFGMSNDDAKLVSDHYPVSVNIDVRADAGGGALSYTPAVFEGAAAQDTPTQLAVGDAAIVGFHADSAAAASGGGDVFSFVLLVDAAKGTELRFTDDGLSGCGGGADPAFRGGEGVITWKADREYAAGSVLQYPTGQAEPGLAVDPAAGSNTWSKSGSFALSASGEPMYAYQGSASSPQWVYAITSVAAASAWGDATNTGTGCLPAALAASGGIDGAAAVHYFTLGSGHMDNFFFSGDRGDGSSGRLKDDWLATIGAHALWTSSNNPIDPTPYLAAFAVAPPPPPTAAPTPAPTPAPTAAPCNHLRGQRAVRSWCRLRV